MTSNQFVNLDHPSYNEEMQQQLQQVFNHVEEQEIIPISSSSEKKEEYKQQLENPFSGDHDQIALDEIMHTINSSLTPEERREVMAATVLIQQQENDFVDVPILNEQDSTPQGQYMYVFVNSQTSIPTTSTDAPSSSGTCAPLPTAKEGSTSRNDVNVMREMSVLLSDSHKQGRRVRVTAKPVKTNCNHALITHFLSKYKEEEPIRITEQMQCIFAEIELDFTSQKYRKQKDRRILSKVIKEKNVKLKEKYFKEIMSVQYASNFLENAADAWRYERSVAEEQVYKILRKRFSFFQPQPKEFDVFM